ncbi:MAG TPA: hypothetical protein VE090_02160 [Methylomirabilota bacterium]|nr:hypothetical protein [Methylomirabilota bacterium]
MALTETQKRKIREEEKYRHAVAASISGKSKKSSQKHGVPLLLSFFVPGLGQLVKGQVKKGLIIFFVPIIVFAIFIIVNFSYNNSNILADLSKIWLASIVLYIWQLIDAYNN